MARGVRDDTRHPMLRRAQALAQSTLERPGQARRRRYGSVEVQEVVARSALTDFHMGRPDGEPSWSLNPYAGCQHACTYCYVPDTLHAERRRWGTYVLSKAGLPRLLAQEVRRKAPATVYVSTATDAYQPIEQERRATRACLEVLARVDWPVDVLTRSPLVLRDIDILQRFSQVRVGVSIPTMDDALRRLVEPAAPPIDARVETLHALHDAGIETYGNYCPAYPPTAGYTPGDIARTFAQAGVRWVNSTGMRYLQDVLPLLRRRLPGHAEWVERATEPRRQQALHAALVRAFEREGIHVHASFFKPPFAARRARTPA